MKIIHEQGYSNEECLVFKSLVYSNMIQSLLMILRAMNKLKIDLEEHEKDVKKFIALANDFEESEVYNEELGHIMKKLWKDNGVQACFKRSREYQLDDSAA